ncbi:MAG: T9SS type A sorting domain-containing protein [Candidatus Marinimicrobia bacterium]|nr:T9SS type A sorting domain-containing protein [Candidatus Neomarinimicrobiota bacterium]
MVGLDSSNYTDTLVWASRVDLGGVDDSVRFKLVPSDGWADGSPDSTAAFHLDNNVAPSVTLASITGEQTGDIPVSYTLSDAETDSLSISLFYTVDSSLTWLPATVSGDTLGVTVYTGALTWNSASDLAGQDLAAVRLYLTPADNDPGSADTTGYFQADNNAPPSVAIDSLPGEWIGDIPIWFDLVDAEGDRITILAEFQEIGTAAWQNANVTGDLTGITVARDSIVWHSDSNLTDFVGDIYFRIIPTDADTGLADTITINIDQIGAPQILTLTIPGGELSGAIEVSFALQDDEGDTVDLYLEYSLDDSASWTAGTISGETTDLDTTRYSGILTWQSGLDTAGIDHAAVLLRVRPWDGHWGPYAYTGPFHLDNNLPPVATAIDLVGEQSGDFPFSYQLSDAENDTLSVTLYYSSDDGDNWSQASASGTTTDLTATQGTLIWHSGTDLPGVDITTAKLLLVPVDADTGTADTTASFHLDNYFGHAVALTLKYTIPEYSDTVGLGVVLSDPTSDVLSVQGYYRVDQSAWAPATLIGDTTGLAAGQYQPALAWDSRADLPGRDWAQVRLKIIPFDNWRAGLADSTGFFHLDNNRAPRITTTLAYDEYAGLLPIPYRITDPEGDTLGFQVDYSTDRLATWTEATLVNPGARIRPQDYQDTLYWDTAVDLPHMDVDSVWLRLQVSDLDTGIGDTTVIHIDNEIGPRVISVYPARETLSFWRDTIRVTLTRPLDAATVTGQISLTGGKFSPSIASATVMDSHLVIVPDLPMSSLDTIKVTLTANIADTNGVSLDGNGNGDPDGSPADDYSWSYYTTVLGDYDLDGVVGFSDLVYFRTAWFSSPQLLDFELSPVVGDIPALRVIPDGKLDIADLAVLARMWDWSISANMSLLAESLNKSVYGDTLIQLTPVYDDKNWDKITKREFAISVSLTEQITTPALEIKLLLDPDILTYEGFEIQGIPDQEKDKWVVLDYYDAETGFLMLELIDFSDGGPALAHEFGLIKFSVLMETEIHTPFEYAIAQSDSAMTIIQGAAFKIISTIPPVPKSFTLHQNFPNPFNPTTRIRYEIAQETQVALVIYNILGQEVFSRNEGYLNPGYYELLWNGRDQTGRQVSSGIYFVRLITAQYTKSIKMMMLK